MQDNHKRLLWRPVAFKLEAADLKKKMTILSSFNIIQDSSPNSSIKNKIHCV